MKNKYTNNDSNLLNILYIEDEDDIRNNLIEVFKHLFKNIYAACDAEEALILYQNNKIDIILSDIGLPGMSGIDFVQIIRRKNKDIPILLLTAYTDTNTLVEAIKLNLVEYLIKPIVFDDLFKHLIALSKKIKKVDTINNIINLGPKFTYNQNLKILKKDNETINITSNESKLMSIFIKTAGKTLSMEEIKSNIWDDYYNTSDAAFKSLLNKLRKKLGEDVINNVHGVGYFLEFQR